MTRMVTLTATLIIAVLALAPLATADVPQMINYQGRLTDDSGNLVPDGSYLMKFKIYGSSTGDDSLWSSGYRGVGITDGLFSYILGDSAVLPNDLFAGGITRYLGIQVQADPEITPRVRLVSAGYAFHALKADTGGYALSISDNSVTSAKIQDGTIQLADISQNGADSGQVMKFDGTNWVAAEDEGASGFFPAPAWESGWFHIPSGSTFSGNHNLGQDPKKYYIDLQFLNVGGLGMCNQGLGTLKADNQWWGAHYKNLTTNTIQVLRHLNDPICDSINVRIWIVQ